MIAIAREAFGRASTSARPPAGPPPPRLRVPSKAVAKGENECRRPHLIAGDLNTFEKDEMTTDQWDKVAAFYKTKKWPPPKRRSLVLPELRKAGYRDALHDWKRRAGPRHANASAAEGGLSAAEGGFSAAEGGLVANGLGDGGAPQFFPPFGQLPITPTTWTHQPLFRIDYMWLSHNISARTYSVVDDDASDHRALVVDAEVGLESACQPAPAPKAAADGWFAAFRERLKDWWALLGAGAKRQFRYTPLPPRSHPPHTHPTALPPSNPPLPPPTLPPPPARASALLACTSHNASRRRYASGRRTRPPSGSALRMLQRPIASGSHRGGGSSSLGCPSFPTFPHRPPLLSSLAYCPSHGCSCQRRC